jgi:tetratricopeptide (TPR) repeat protein
VKRTLAIATVLVLAAAWGGFAYQEAGRERDYRDAVRQGDTALLREEAVNAIEAYSGAIALRPDSMLAHLRRGETYLLQGDLEAAGRDFQEASALDPTATRPLERLGDVRYGQRRFARAVEFYEARLRLDDRSSSVTYKLALALYRAENFSAAIAALERLKALDDRMPAAFQLLGLCLLKKDRLDDAIQALEKAVSLGSDLIAARETLAEAYERAGRRAEQVEQLQALVSLERGDRIDRVIAVAEAQARMGHHEAAVLTLRDLLQRTTDHASVYAAVGRAWLRAAEANGDRAALGKAVGALGRAAASPDTGSGTLAAYARALAMSGQAEAAERTYLRAAQRFPVEPTAFREYAALAERHGRLEAARDALVRYHALAAEPGIAANAAALAGRIASLSLKLNDARSALLWWQRASAATPNDVQPLIGLAEAQIRVGDRGAARATIGRGLEREPGNQALLALYRRTS